MYEAEYFSKNCPLLIKTKKCHRSRIPMKDFRILFCIRSIVCDWTLLDHQIDAEKPAKRFQKCALFSKIPMPSVVWKPCNRITWKYFYEKITFWINSRFLEWSEYWKTERAGSELSLNDLPNISTFFFPNSSQPALVSFDNECNAVYNLILERFKMHLLGWFFQLWVLSSSLIDICIDFVLVAETGEAVTLPRRKCMPDAWKHNLCVSTPMSFWQKQFWRLDGWASFLLGPHRRIFW